MEADFIDKMQQIRLTEEEGEVLEIRFANRDKTLEECSLSLRSEERRVGKECLE